MTSAALGGALTVGDEQALEAHLAGCAACRADERATARLGAALRALAVEAEVPLAVEQATLRRVRALGAEESASWLERVRGWGAVPVLAAGATAAVVVGVTWRGTGFVAPAPTRVVRTLEAPAADLAAPVDGSAVSVASAPAMVPEVGPIQPREEQVERGRHLAAAAGTSQTAVEPPAEFAATFDLLLEMPILEHLEKLQNFEVIETTDVTRETGASG